MCDWKPKSRPGGRSGKNGKCSSLQSTFPNSFYGRATKAGDSSSPSKTPISVTQSLSELRLTHARLLEEHGATVALLRRREAELADADARETESQQAIQTLQADLRAVKDKVGRREQRALLAEREVGFLQALVVRVYLTTTTASC